MMIGERNHHPNQTVHAPPWAIFDEPSVDYFPNFLTGKQNCNAAADDFSHYLLGDSLTASMQRYLPSNNLDFELDELSVLDSDLLMDSYTCDQFRMFEFKVRKCTRARSHDWTECPYVHPGEKARRRDPMKYSYSGTACPDFRKGSCKKGDACEFSHGVFECWLHPARYRTQPCKDGSNCSRRICFFAHSPDQIRVVSPRSYEGSSRRLMFVSSPESGSPPSDSPPMSPMMSSPSRSVGFGSFNEVVASLRQLQLKKAKSMPTSAWVGSPTGIGSPRMVLRPGGGYSSLPNTPTTTATTPTSSSSSSSRQVPIRRVIGSFDNWEQSISEEEEPLMMERVESGRGLRARMFEKLSRENPLDVVGDPQNVSWISDIVK